MKFEFWRLVICQQRIVSDIATRGAVISYSFDFSRTISKVFFVVVIDIA